MKTSERKVLKGYYWNHDAIRKDMGRLKKVVANYKTYSATDFAHIAKWFRYHTQCILYHHQGEDDYFFPIMKERKPQFKIELDNMEHEHVMLDDGLEKLNELFARLSSGKSVLAKEFTEVANNYITLVTMHLDQEEKIVELIVNDIPVQEVLKTEDEYRKRLPRSEMSLIMPWMVDAMDDTDKNFFFGMTPFFVKWIYNFSAKSKFDKMVTF